MDAGIDADPPCEVRMPLLPSAHQLKTHLELSVEQLARWHLAGEPVVIRTRQVVPSWAYAYAKTNVGWSNQVLHPLILRFDVILLSICKPLLLIVADCSPGSIRDG